MSCTPVTRPSVLGPGPAHEMRRLPGPGWPLDTFSEDCRGSHARATGCTGDGPGRRGCPLPLARRTRQSGSITRRRNIGSRR
jgi:hypothetical protein